MIFNMVGGGGGSGATLVVSSPANVSVTVSKDDKSYTKNSGSLGSATFKGLATGTWTVTISGNGQTATKTIEITADYAITIAFFSATINITYPANSTCVVTNSGGQTVASDTNTGTSTKTWTATVNATGTYTVTATATDGSGKSKSTTVSITAENQTVSVTLSFAYYVYNYGDLCTENSGGWKGQNATTSATNKADHLYILSNNAQAMAGPNNKVDVTRYKTMVIEAELVGNYPGTTIGLISSYTGAAAAYVQPSTIRQVQEIDISALSGEYYPYVARSDALACKLYMVKFL